MDRKVQFRSAFKEALADTAVAALINIPINLVLISIALHLEMNAYEMTTFFTIVFTIIAVIRKTTVRMHFAKRAMKKKEPVKSASKFTL